MDKIMMKYLKDWASQPYWGTEFQNYQFARFKSRMITLFVLVFSIVISGVPNDHFNWWIGESPSFVDGSGYKSMNTSPSSNVFELKEVTSEFSIKNIITIGDSKKEHDITEVTELQRSGSGNSQLIFIMDGVGFETKTGIKVSVFR